MAVTNDELKNLRRFLVRASSDDAFRAELENSRPNEVRAMLLERYGIDIEIPDKRLIPSKDVCKELLVWTCWLEEYADVAIREALFMPIYMVVGHAMPLAVTAEEGVGATG